MDYDVAVIGAGAAGLAAGLALQRAGRRFVVLEARDRIGGRAFTDHASFPGIAFDRGGHWLHAASINPFTTIAAERGFRFDTTLDWARRSILTGNGRTADIALAAAAQDALYGALDRIVAAGRAGRDVAMASLLDPADPWHRITYCTLTLINSGDPEVCSTLDSSRYADTNEDFPVRDGYGALVAAHAAGLPVSLSTPVTAVDWSGAGVAVQTPGGTVKARVAILALPTNVVASGAVRFTPALPARLTQALHDCPMGHAEKIAFRLDRPMENFAHVYAVAADGPPVMRQPFTIQVSPFGLPLITGHVGGSHARDLATAGAGAMRDFGMEALVHAFGSGFRQRVVGSLATDWTTDPWTRGAYSHCLPGRADARLVFDEPVGERIFLAGEHCGKEAYSTIHGAHQSGEATARRVLDEVL